MIFVQFYQRSTLNPLDIVEACGDRSVVILDGRNKPQTHGRIAEEECKKRGYAAWRIYKGDAFSRSSPVSGLNYVQETDPVRDPVWLSAHGM